MEYRDTQNLCIFVLTNQGLTGFDSGQKWFVSM